MAKKRSYNPNTVLIQGQRDVAQSIAMRNSASGTGFAKGFTNAVLSGIEEQEKSKAQMDAFNSVIKSPENITAVNAANRPEILKFVRQTRAKVVDLLKAHKATGDQGILDEVEIEKAKIVNLNNQLMGFANGQKNYMMASDKNQIARGKSFDYKKYDSVFSENSKVNIDPDGNLGFITDGVYDKWVDMDGKWNVNNNIWGSSMLKLDSAIVSNAKKGAGFDAQGIKNNVMELFKQMGPEEIQVAVEQDVTGDAYENLSFESIWSSGGMDPKYYKGFESFKNKDGSYNSDWMFDDNNAREATRLMSDYTTDVLKTRHDANYVDPNQRRQQYTPEYIQESRAKVKEVDDVVKAGVTKENLYNITIKSNLRREITENEDGTFTIWAANGDAVDIDPKKPEEARQKLYGLAGVRSADKSKGGGAADNL
tara:strand:+ start:308 stop:1579 length:1272 start_codon:yes stop_codon:yes gene_type:complete